MSYIEFVKARIIELKDDLEFYTKLDNQDKVNATLVRLAYNENLLKDLLS